MYGGKDALNDPPLGVVHEGAHWVWFIIPMGRKLNGYQVQVSALGYRYIALLRHKAAVECFRWRSCTHSRLPVAYTATLRDAFKMHTKVIGFRWDLGDASCSAEPGTTPQSSPGFGGLLPMVERHSPKLLVAYTATLSGAKQPNNRLIELE